MDHPRILLADDHAETRGLLRHLLCTEFDVVAEATDGPALVRAAEQCSPDAIVTDISLPGLGGLGAAAAILLHNRDARIVFVTVIAEPALIRRAFATGALAYVLKNTAGEDLIPAVHAALRGERHPCLALGQDQ